MFKSGKSKRKSSTPRDYGLVILLVAALAGGALFLLQLRSSRPLPPPRPTQTPISEPTRALTPVIQPPTAVITQATAVIGPPTDLPPTPALPTTTPAPPPSSTATPLPPPTITSRALLRPPGTLYWMRDSQTYALNLQTLQSEAGSALPNLDGQTSAAPSRDGNWYATWENSPNSTTLRLVLQTYPGLQTVRTFGDFSIWDTHITWSPDSEWMLINTHSQQVTDEWIVQMPEIWRVHRESGAVEALTDGTFPAEDPVYAPVIDQFSYTREGALWVMNLTDKTNRMILPADREGRQVKWSPDGEWLAYTRPDFGPTPMRQQGPPRVDIWAIRADGTQAQELIRDGALIGWGP